MNIFWLDHNPILNAQYHVDKHVVKMPLEAAQLACTAVHLFPHPDRPTYVPPYKATHVNHPCAQYARKSLYTYHRVIQYGLALCDEYTYRYGKKHACETVLLELRRHPPAIPASVGPVRPPLCMPDFYFADMPALTTAYRRYYVGHKANIFSWRDRERPEWTKVQDWKMLVS